MENRILLSLCIPTNGVVEWIMPVIESIYAQGVDNSLFEVVVTDNGEKDELQEAVKRIEYENFHYYRTNSKGFTNQIDAFEKCSGEFCKMQNHRCKLMAGSLNQLLDFIRKYRDTKPILYCADGHAKGGEFIECVNTDEFVKKLSYWISWSAGTGAWRDDIKDVRNKYIDRFFPHTVFLFGLRNESKYVIWNGKYEIMADDAGKGGYDFYHTFAVVLLDLISALRIDERISIQTFLKFKRDLLYDYLYSFYYSDVVCPTKRTYIVQNVRESMMVYYSDWDYRKMVFWSYFRKPFAIIKHTLLKLVGKK